MRIFSSFLTLALLVGGIWWAWNNVPQTRQFVERHLHTGGIQTLEIRYTAEQLMEQHAKAMLKDEQHTYLPPSLFFYPYVLMEVKFSDDNKMTREGVILWGLENGEMVLDAHSWECTHGYRDCLLAAATKDDFRIINALARRGGSLHRDELVKVLHADADIIDHWIEGCRRKKLVVQHGSICRLHFEKPHFALYPQTQIKQWLATKPSKEVECVGRHFTISQVERLAQAGFGSDFAMKNVREVCLPVHRISVQNPDGTCTHHLWNALTGERMGNL